MKDDNYLNYLRHSTSHLLAAAVLELWPNAKLTIGPAIKDGFYYDIDFSAQGGSESDQINQKVSADDFSKIEAKMHKLVRGWTSFEKYEVSKGEALKEFKGNEYKEELIKEHSSQGDQLTIYQSGNFRDLCRGGHIENPSKEIKHFKLLFIAGAYWRGDEKNKMLTRIYGTAFESEEKLKEHLARIEEAKRRDHRELGKRLNLFTFSDLIGSGFPLYTPRGAYIRLAINNYVEEIQSKQGYTQVWTPQVAKAELYKISGHYDKYKDDMFIVKSHYSDEEFFLKPMNCPQHTQIYASSPHSYRDLPIRLTDFAMLYRDEKPGELSGLARVRSFSQDDCHIFCRDDQVDSEIDMALSMTKEIMQTFGFKYRYRLSSRDPEHPEKYLGDPAIWDKLESWAIKIMERNNIEYFDGPGEAAFYGPKMDLIATDALGREWQLSTVQIDMVQPERFKLEYTDSDGTSKRPVMIHRAIVGSPERFMMILIEHFAGAFPLWLAPTQVAIIPISQDQTASAKLVEDKLKTIGVRVELWNQAESMQKRIRTAEKQKIPYMLIIGQKEAESESVSVRIRGQQDLGVMTTADFMTRVQPLIESKSLKL